MHYPILLHNTERICIVYHHHNHILVERVLVCEREMLGGGLDIFLHHMSLSVTIYLY